ncbi:MAG: carboxypeptidase regulatory-like domain-containing protein, partial [Gemmatimonadaceae bacterium]
MVTQSLRIRSTLWIMASAALAVAPLSAQIVQGTVLARGTAAPLRGAVVSGVQDGSGLQGPRVLTDVDGHFAWRAPGAGTWTLEIRSIGFLPTQRPVTLSAAETVRLSVTLERAALFLAGVRVQERNSCRARAELALDASTLWNDIWSALAAAVASRDVSRQALRLTRYARTRKARSGVVDHEERTSSRAQTTRPFLAVAAAELAKSGFRVAHDDGSTTFYAPDAETLIAPEFIARHCYGIARADSGARPLVGVSFWPRRGMESADVEGVLWVDAQSRELRTVEFHYPGLRDLEDGAASRFGGFASYARQPDGSWIIDAWQIRVPVVAQTRRVIGVGNRRFGEDVRDSVVQISEEGGFASIDGGGRRFGVISGSVRDEAGHPEPGASLELVGTTVASMADSLGMFKLTDVLPGRYLARVYRGTMDARTSFLLQSEIEVALGDSLTWNPVVTERASIRTACPDRSDRSREAAVEVVVRDAISQRPLRLRRLQFLVSTLASVSVTRLQRHEETLERTTDWRGEIALCDIPPLAELRVREPTAATWSFPMRIRAVFTVIEVDVDAEAGLVTVLSADDPATTLTAPEVRAAGGTVIGGRSATRTSLVGRLISDDSTPRALAGAEVTADV